MQEELEHGKKALQVGLLVDREQLLAILDALEAGLIHVEGSKLDLVTDTGLAYRVRDTVSIPGTDGRAGMSAIVVNEGFDVAALPAHLARRLPAYARPVFIRISRELDATETFKQKKGDLAREGFDPGAIADPLFVADPKSGAYVALDAEMHARILGGSIRL